MLQALPHPLSALFTKGIKYETNRLSIVAATLTALTQLPANAQTFTTDLASFQTAAPSTTLYDFEGIAAPSSFAINPAVLVTPASGRVTFSVSGGSDTTVYATDSAFFSGNFQLSDGSDSVAAGVPSNSASTTTISLDGLYTAFAIEYGMQNNDTNSFSFALFNNNTQVGTTFVASSAGGDRFFGATSAISFNNVRATAASGVAQFVVFDNVRTGSTVVVPEAGTFALLLPALGVFGVALAKRRMKNA